MNLLTKPLLELPEIDKALNCINKKKLPILLTGCMDAQKCNIIEALSEAADKRHKVIITYDEIRAREIQADMKLYDKKALIYPAKDIMFFAADVHGNAIVSGRLEVIKRLIEEKPSTVILSLEAGLDRVLPLSYVKERIVRLSVGESYDITELGKKLAVLGYEKTSQVSGKGQFAVRGDIFDIFPLTEETPMRLEFWGDEIDSIRAFDVESQRSIENVEELLIYPASEIIIDEERKNEGLKRLNEEKDEVYKRLRADMKTEEAARIHSTIEEFKDNLEIYGGSFGIDSYINYFFEETVTFFDYFNEEDIFFIDEPIRIEEKGKAVSFEWRESMGSRLEKGYILSKQADTIWDYKTVLAKLAGKTTVLLSLLETRTGDIEAKQRFDVLSRHINPYNNSFETLIKDLTRYKKEGYRVVVVSSSRARAERLAEDFRDRELMANYLELGDRVPVNGEVVTIQGNLRKGFEYPSIKFAIISESDIFGAEKKKTNRKKKKIDGASIASFSELHEGDYVIHENHGIGIYRGIEKFTVEGVTKDYVKVDYSGDVSIFVPTTNLDILQKYSSASGAKPKIDRVGGQAWKKTKSKVRESISEIARDLVELYAKRQQEQGFKYSGDTVWQQEFEEMFPYDETNDQLNAIKDVKADMESIRIMDRLVCGDVGFGKTEVAIRAAFKAVSEGKQVVMLVPTTILAGQHFATFSKRMQNFPITVEFLSRFKSAAETKKIKEKLKAGLIDIIIGTHKVLSAEIKYKDLGLLIIDEEQRFGVSHKEKIKKLRQNVDVLTLSATPIPRTLHMSLVGIRDMSVLEEPPVDRIPIQTYVLEHDDEIIREAINREIGRGGQIYYVYNRVNGIEDVAGKIAEMVPHARVSYAHGQMNERELERIMFEFINGEIDVLVSTTIIETGLDISNVNTIIIDDADKMGLSQLYQLRGRVGRSSRTSYAFLMYKRDRMLKEIAEKRLAAIKEFTDLGSGFKIAMKDLEIRGAGNLLGKSQSGHMEAVGYDLYCKMLNEEVKRLKGEAVSADEYDTLVDIEASAYIPAEYIRNEVSRLEMYKRIAAIYSDEELLELKDELIDRYGEMPDALDNLINISYIRQLAHEAGATKVESRDEKARIDIYTDIRFDVNKLGGLMSESEGRLKLKSGKDTCFEYRFGDGVHKTKAEEKIKALMWLVKELSLCRLKEEKEG